jgi:hypothetical protein
MKLIVNNLRLYFGFLTTTGKTKIDPYQPAERLIRRSDNARNQMACIEKY